MGLIRITEGALIGGKWQLQRRIGRGGMGEVWLAAHHTIANEVAVKVLDRDAFPLDVADEARSRFHLEAQLAAELARRTRHIAAVFDHGTDDGIDYLVMELLVGESLEDLLQREKVVDAARVAAILQQAARGLRVAHQGAVIHRDLKPSNIYLTTDESGEPLVKLLDFGIAKAWQRESQRHRTRDGVLLGTAAYMSPEQARGLEIDARADVWALACVGYELITGSLPFEGTSEVDLLMRICTTDPAPPSSLRPELSPEVDAVFARAFARSIDDRFPDAGSLAAALAAAVAAPRLDSLANATFVAEEPPPRAPRRVPLVLGAVAIAALLGGFVVARTAAPPPAPPPAKQPVALEPHAVAPPASTSVAPADPAPPAASVSATATKTKAKGSPAAKPAPAPAPKPAATKVDKSEIL